MLETERIRQPSQAEIKDELAAKQTRMEQIYLRTPDAEFRLKEENEELRQLTEDIARLKRELSSLQKRNAV